MEITFATVQEIMERMSYIRKNYGKFDKRNEEYFKQLSKLKDINETVVLPETFTEFEDNSFNSETGKYEIEGVA